jgi:hypothetical protein
VRTLLVLMAIGAVPVALHAQDKPDAATVQALTATWTFDQSQSDTIPANPMAMLRRRGGSAPVRAPSRGGGGGGGGGGRRRGGGGGGGGGGGAGGADSTPVFGQRNNAPERSPAMAYVVIEMVPAPTLTITATDTSITLDRGGGRSTTWITDGKTRQEALMEGGILESQGEWSGKTLELTRDIPNSASLQREFKLDKAGTTLEIKETLKYNGEKVEKKLVFTRAQ